jgi:hypothetical protein
MARKGFLGLQGTEVKCYFTALEINPAEEAFI